MKTKEELTPEEFAKKEEISLKEYISDLLHVAHYDTGDMDDNAFDKWTKKMIKSIDKYYKSKQPTVEVERRIEERNE